MKSWFVSLQNLAAKDTTQRTVVPQNEKHNPAMENQVMTSTKNIIDHHLGSFKVGDLNGLLSDYAPGAVMFTPNRVLRGEDEIRALFQAMIAEFGKPGAASHLQQQFVADNHAYLL